ncbi:MAG: VIT1/CCC1 transporter family protein [Thermoplasmata archaeon]|nr:VIT1/CCC1 transporter family protein [Thermoplasmata archaeon]MCI4329638.1 VIT1/CCC1 transporter family protein [Thermoplasmata archaeon]MCI4332401.1 VIT1/CCC1 transporter family protein [Thermoplasmata archaeon]
MSTPPAQPSAAGPGLAPSHAIDEGHKAHGADKLEDSVFGVLDGVITAVSLSVATAGVVRLDHAGVFLTVVAAAVAGALSMFSGALLSARGKRDLVARERAREEREVDEKPEEERREVHDIYRARGFTEEETEILLRRITSDRKLWIDTMMRDELGLPPEVEAEPLTHAGTIGAYYLLGGILPALPFLTGWLPVFQELELSVAIASAELAAVGVFEAHYAGKRWFQGLGEILLIGLGTAVAVLLVTLVLQPGL